MTVPAYGESASGGPQQAAAQPGPPAAYAQYAGQGYPIPAYRPRPRKPYAAALILAAVGFALEAASSFLYWPRDTYSLNLARAAAVTGGFGYVVLGIAAVVAVATTVSR